MQKNTLSYTIKVLLCLTVFTANAQKKTIEPVDTLKIPFYNGFTVQVDISSVVSPVFTKGVSYSYEAGLQVDLKHNLYPILEIGYAGADKTSPINLGFKTDAIFERIGIDFNILKKKKDSKPTNNLFLAGIRLGMSNFNYRISNATISDDYWGGTETVDYSNIPTCTKIWWEIVAGVRVEMVKNFYMGWTIRNKNLISQDADGTVSPWYIPGYGKKASNNWGFNYYIAYHF